MLNQPGTPGHSLGLSVGATNLAGSRDGHTAVIHPAAVTLHGQRLTGFVDRVGDPVPLVAPDGTNHRPELLLAEALGAVAHSSAEGLPVSDTAITVPAHWRPSVVDTVRRSMRDGMPVVSDATAALTALSANPGLPTRGVIVLCDFGGSGTSITLANASSNYAVVGETVRYADFSGDHIDQALLTHIVSGLDVSHADPFGTAMVGSLAALRDECRRAKERLSGETATAVTVDLAEHRTDVRVTRLELEDLMQASLAGFLAALDDTLERYGVPPASVAAVATVGGGARIPLVTQRLSDHLRAAVVTTPRPQLTAAEGAALIAARSRVTETATTLAPAAGLAAPTGAFDAGQPSTAVGALAWSEDDGEDELPFADAAMDTEYYQRPTDSRPELVFQQDERQEEAPARRAPLVLFGLSAVAVVLTAAAFALMQLTGTTTSPVEAATTVTSSPAPAAPVLSPAPPAPQAPQVTTVVVKPAQRPNPQPRPHAPVPQHPPVTPTTTAPPTTTPPTTTSPTTPPPTTTPPTTTPPTTTPPSTPAPPPIDPGPGNGGETGTPPIDPGNGTGDTGFGTPPDDLGNGTGDTDTGTPPNDSSASDDPTET